MKFPVKPNACPVVSQHLTSPPPPSAAKQKEFILGEGGSNMKKLVGRTGCRVQLSNMANRYMLADQEIWITGPEDEANEATREIMRLAAEDGLSKAPVA